MHDSTGQASAEHHLSVTRLTKASYVDKNASTGAELANAMYTQPAPAATGVVVRLDAFNTVLKPVSDCGT